MVIGPRVPTADAHTVCNYLRLSAPQTSVILVRDEVDTEILAAAMQAGARDVVLSSTPVGVEHAVERAAQLAAAARTQPEAVVQPVVEEPPAPAPREPGKVITVWSPKGGVGKTTAAVNLALTLSERGKQVCLVDLDLAFGDVAITMQLFPTHSIEHAIGKDQTLTVEELQGLLTLHSDSMAILAAPTTFPESSRIGDTESDISRSVPSLRRLTVWMWSTMLPLLMRAMIPASSSVRSGGMRMYIDCPTASSAV